MKHKILPLILSVVLILTLTACDNAKTVDGKTNELPAASGTDEQVISIFLPSRRSDSLYSMDTLTIAELAKRMDVTFDIDTAPSNGATAKLSVIVSSGEIPDITAGNVSLLKQYGEEGAFLALDELIDDRYPNLKKYLLDNPEVMAQSISSDGHLYVVPMQSAVRSAMGYMIRQDLLDEYGLEKPVTIDDWYKVLSEFKKRGVSTPLFLDKAWEDYCHMFSDAWGIELTKSKDYFTVIDGKKAFAPITEECREYLATMQTWYEEGLIDKEFMTRENTCDYHVLNNLAGAGCYWSGYLAGMNDNPEVIANDPDTNWEIVDPPVLNAGDEPRTFSQQAKTVGYGWSVSSETDKADKILEIFEYVYSDEGSVLFNFGIENESFVKKGEDYKYSDKVVEEGTTEWVMRNGCQAYIGMRQMPEYETAQAGSDAACYQLLYYDNNNLFYPMNPVLTMDEDSKDRYDAIMEPIISYVDEELIKFITGDRSMDEFDSFVNKINSMGIEEAEELQNDAYEKYKSLF